MSQAAQIWAVVVIVFAAAPIVGIALAELVWRQAMKRPKGPRT